MTNVKLCPTCKQTELMADPCEECGGEGGTGQSNCIDDMCNGGDVPCLHGDDTEYTCGTCDGRGAFEYCPVCIVNRETQGPSKPSS